MSSVNSLFDLSLNSFFDSFDKEKFNYMLQYYPNKFIFEILFKVNIKMLFKISCDIYIMIYICNLFIFFRL